MSDAVFARARAVAAPSALTADFFRDGNAWFRLNPEWEVLSFKDAVLKVRYERSEAEVEWRVATEVRADGCSVALDGESSRRILLEWQANGDAGVQIEYRENFDAPIEVARTAELNLWLDAAAGYLALAARHDRRGRFGKWLLDKFWLRMSPTARRVGLIVIAMEALALLLFIAVVIVYRIAG